ncbi:MAG TPA: hypothetical protein VEA78_05685 [Acidimicrobiales bacterium]|nr:hypothetical protein [Acidimicrobiales bacterium]
MTIRRVLLPVLLLLLSVLAACGKGGESPALSGEPIEEPSTTTTAAPDEGEAEGDDDASDAADAADATLIEITGAEYAYFGGLPTEPVPAGEVTVSLENTGAEEHQASLVRFKDGKTVEDLIAIGEDPSQLPTIVDGYGGPNGVAPGATVASTQVLEAGEYLFICFIPAPDGQPHAVKGMLAPFTVEGEAPEEPAASENEPVVMDEYTFGAEDGPTYDGGFFSFENEGEQLHEAAVYGLAEGATIEDAVAFFEDPASAVGPPPITSAGGIGPITPGIRSEVELELAPGDYVFACFIPDVADGAPHLVKGMIEGFTIE